MLDAILGMTTDEDEATFPPPAHDPFWYDDSIGPISGISPEMSLQSAAVWACVRVLAESVGSLPAVLYERLPDGGKEKAVKNPLYELFHDQPNNWQTSSEFWEQSMYHLSLRGNFLADLIPGRRGGTDQLEPIHPDRVEAKRRSDNLIDYTIRNPNTGREFKRETYSILHVRGLSSDGVWGIHPVRQLRKTIALGLGQDEFAQRFFKQGVQPSGVISHPQQLGDDAYNRLLQQMAEHRGSKNAHKTLILEEGMEWTQTSMTNRDAQFLQSRQYSTVEIARMFRVPPHMIADLTRATFSNIEHQSLDFVVHTLRPWLVRIEKAIRRDVIVQFRRFFLEFNVDGLLRGDFKTRIEGYAKAIQAEILNRNEVREMENRNPVPGGNEFKNPAINPQGSPDREKGMDGEPLPEEPPEDSRQARMLNAYSRDIGGRIARRELSELGKRVKHADGDNDRFQEWCSAFYPKHAEYVDEAIAPLCEALHVRMVDRVAFVECVTQRSCREILDTPQPTYDEYADGKLADRYTRMIRGLAA